MKLPITLNNTRWWLRHSQLQGGRPDVYVPEVSVQLMEQKWSVVHVYIQFIKGLFSIPELQLILSSLQ